jgi:hypothetical protein
MSRGASESADPLVRSRHFGCRRIDMRLRRHVKRQQHVDRRQHAELLTFSQSDEHWSGARGQANRHARRGGNEWIFSTHSSYGQWSAFGRCCLSFHIYDCAWSDAAGQLRCFGVSRSRFSHHRFQRRCRNADRNGIARAHRNCKRHILGCRCCYLSLRRWTDRPESERNHSDNRQCHLVRLRIAAHPPRRRIS